MVFAVGVLDMKVSDNFREDVEYRRMHRVFQMVSELHKLGYQGLRIHTQFYMSRRIWITPAILVNNDDVRQTQSHFSFSGAGAGNNFIVLTNDGATNEGRYFLWSDAQGCNARQLANKFLERFPQVSDVSLMDDLAYAGWLSRLIGEMEQGWYPVWISGLGFIRLKPTCDETRALEQRLTRDAITQSEIDTLNNSDNFVGYSRPLEIYTHAGGELLGPGVQMRYLSSNGEGDDQQQAEGVYLTFPLPPPVNIDNSMLTGLLAKILGQVTLPE